MNATLQYTHTCAHKGTDIWVTAALSQLTATAPGRQQVRGQGAYLILRELHSWEPEPDVRVACEKLIQVCAGLEGGLGVHSAPASCSPAPPAGRCLLGMSRSTAWKTCWRCRCLKMWSSSYSSWTAGNGSSANRSSRSGS